MPATIMPAMPDVTAAPEFVDRRGYESDINSAGRERRQFTNSHSELSFDAAELAKAIDHYKLQHRRRFINFEEMMSIIKLLGYSK